MSAVRFLLLLLCLSLSPPRLVSISEAEALLEFKKTITTPESLESWKSGSDPCKDKWRGVFCDDSGAIIRLHLTNMGLSGTVDVNSISEIKNLKTLSLSNNSFEGALPPLNMLKGLRALYVSANKFSGYIPGEFFADSTLRRIWLSDNEFTGNIPESLGKINGLSALHLERNKFSGAIPEIAQKSLTELDMSGNQLEGEVPASMERFGANAFKDNDGVCGKVVSKECSSITNEGKKKGGHSHSTIFMIVGIVVIMAILLFVSTMKKSKNKYNQEDEDFGMLHKARGEDMVDVHVQGSSKGGATAGGGSNKSSNKSSTAASAGAGGGGSVGGGSKKSNTDSTNKKGGGSEHRGKKPQGKSSSMGDLTIINNEKGTFGLADLMKASAEVLGNGALGSAYKAVMGNGVSVVVKRIRDMNRMGKEEFDSEITRIGKLCHKNILTPLAYHYRKEEKLVVSEYIPKGSLLYVLHGDRGLSHAELTWATRLKIIKGVASGLQYLYKEFSDYELPHGNLKSSNIFLNENYEPLLADYGFFKMIAPSQAAQGMFAYKAPESVETQQVSSKGDVYCLGIVILEVLTGKFPTQYLNAGKGGTNVIQWVRSAIEDKKENEFIDPEITSNASTLEPMIQLLHLGARCTETDPNKRPTMADTIKRIEEIKA